MSDPFEGWAIVELMGHRRLSGYVSETTFAGAGFVRVQFPKSDGDGFDGQQLYGPSAIYCVTPVTEHTVRATRGQLSSVPALGPPAGTPPEGIDPDYPADDEPDEEQF